MRAEFLHRRAWVLAPVFLLGGGITLTGCESGNPPTEEPVVKVSEPGAGLRPRSLDEAARTQVLVLASPHLRMLGDRFDASLLSSLLGTLEVFKPDVVAVEQIPPHVIQAMLGREDEFAEALEQFAGATVRLAAISQQRLGLSPREASEAASELLRNLRSAAGSSDTSLVRARLVMHLLASYQYASAVLQWSYLVEADQAQSDIVPQDVADALTEQLGANSEDMAVGIALARRLGLQRVEAIDDHTDKDLFLQFADQLVAQLEGNPAFESAIAAPIYTESTARLDQAVDDGDLLPYYLYMNSTEYGAADVEAQFHVFFRTQLPSGLDRARSAVWELRNLNIASNIRRISAMYPGQRVLVVIGAGHKPFLDNYLGQMMDVNVAQLSDLVGGTQ